MDHLDKKHNNFECSEVAQHFTIEFAVNFFLLFYRGGAKAFILAILKKKCIESDNSEQLTKREQMSS